MKAFRDACVIKFYPEYAALMPKWPKGLYDKINYAREQMDRLAFTVMRPVKFDKYFKVIDEPENLANHEWNLKWLRAFVDENADNEKGTYKIDEKTINEMIEEEVGNIENLVNKMEMPPIPTKENPTDAELLEFQPRIAEWYRRVMTNSPDVFHQLGIKALGWDGLRKLSPAFKEWDQQNKYLFSIGDLCTNISGNSMYFDRVFFRINKEGDSIEKILETKEQRDANVAIYEEIQKNKKTIEVLYKACYNFGKERANKDKYPTFKQIVESMKKEEKK